MYDEHIPIPKQRVGTVAQILRGMTKPGQSYFFDVTLPAIYKPKRELEKETGRKYKTAKDQKDGIEGIRVWLVSL
jgi:hypothetical protein